VKGRDRALKLIALFKFCKAVLLATVGLGVLKLLRPSVAAQAQHWVAALAAGSARRDVQRLLALVNGLPPGRLEALGIGAFLYAGLFMAEGVGLWLAKRWAEYLTIVATMLLIPFEIFELTRRASVPRVTALVLNLTVVAYLIYRLLVSRETGSRPAALTKTQQ
jgi:uncharacterized membrane protein (DUF2068 family)